MRAIHLQHTGQHRLSQGKRVTKLEANTLCFFRDMLKAAQFKREFSKPKIELLSYVTGMQKRVFALFFRGRTAQHHEE